MTKKQWYELARAAAVMAAFSTLTAVNANAALSEILLEADTSAWVAALHSGIMVGMGVGAWLSSGELVDLVREARRPVL